MKEPGAKAPGIFVFMKFAKCPFSKPYIRKAYRLDKLSLQ